MSVGDVTATAAEAKTVYDSATLDEAINKNATYRSQLKRDIKLKFTEGGTATVPFRLGGGFGAGGLDDLGSFPAGADPNNVTGTITPVAFASTIQLSLQSKLTNKSGKSGFVDGGIVADRVEQAVPNLATLINRVYAGGNRGAIATVLTDGSSALTLDPANNGALLLEDGFVVDVYSAVSSGSVRDSLSARTLSAVNKSLGTVTYSGADQTAVAGDSVFPQNLYTQSPYGLRDIVDDGTNLATYMGKARATAAYNKLKAHIFTAGGVTRTVTEALVLQAADRPAAATSKKVTKILTSYGVGRALANMQGVDRRYAANTSPQSYSFGFDKLNVAIPGMSCDIEMERHAPPRSIYFLAWDTFGLAMFQDIEFVTEGGAMWHLIPGTSTYKAGVQAFLLSYENQFSQMPHAQSVLGDLKDDSLDSL